jgi:hypothetical protein
LQADNAELTRLLPRAVPEHRSDYTPGIIAQRLALNRAAEVGLPCGLPTYRPASQPR